MIPSFASQRVTILNPQTVTEWGNDVVTFDDVEGTTVTCVWQGANLGEQIIDSMDAAMGSRTIFLNPGTQITASSRVRFPDEPGRDWEVIGEPALFKSPTGAVSNLMVVVRRWESEQ